jgi:hypothetical protein
MKLTPSQRALLREIAEGHVSWIVSGGRTTYRGAGPAIVTVKIKRLPDSLYVHFAPGDFALSIAGTLHLTERGVIESRIHPSMSEAA